MGFYFMVHQVTHKRSYQSTGSYIRFFSVLSTRCHTKGPTNLVVLIYRFLVYCLPGVTQEVLLIYRFLYTGFYCIVFQVSHKRSYQSTGSYIRVFSVLSKRCHTKGLTNLQVPIYRVLVYCLAGITQKVLPIYIFLYTGFQCIVLKVSHKRSYKSTGSYIRAFSVLSTSCHTKGPTNLQFLIYGFFTVLCSRCHTKGPTNLQVLIYGFLVYCLPGVTQKVLPIYMFLYTDSWCIVCQVSHKRSYQSRGSYIRVFSVLSIRCHTKGPTNLKVLIYVFQCIVYHVSHKRSYQSTGSYIRVLVYCLRGVTQKVLPIYRFLYIGFFCIAYQVSHKRFYQSTASYIRDFSFINTLRRFGMYLNHNSQSLFGEYRSMPGVLNYWFLYIHFSVLSTSCHTNGSTNLQDLIYHFQCIVYQVSHKRSYQSTDYYIRDFSFMITSRRFGIFLNHNSQSLFGEY